MSSEDKVFSDIDIHQTTASDIITYMESMQNEVQRQIMMRFFKTGRGEYGYGDRFLGLKAPQTREVVRQAKELPLEQIPALLKSRWHEVRLCGFLIMVDKFKRLTTKSLLEDAEAAQGRDVIVKMYLRYARRANNWDLVDMTAPKILGHWLMLPTCITNPKAAPAQHQEYKLHVLDSLAESDNLWEQRISMVCTWKTNQMGNPFYCLRYAEKHLHHPHDLMHKATGWMLREMGKRIDMNLLRDFLQKHAHEMPRTMLRYAIEQMPEDERHHWMTHH